MKWVDDILANGEMEDRAFRDVSLSEQCAVDIHDPLKPRVMNDVCMGVFVLNVCVR
jgi:hypothetical protein